jgi:outer membrane protein
MKHILILAVVLLTTALTAQQKYGHLNTGNLLESMPEVKQADSALILIQDSLQKKENEMIEAFEKEYMDFVKQANAGELPKVTIDKKQAEFQQKENDILQYRREVQTLIIQKRQELLDPILERVQKAVDKVAKEQGFTYIFDIGSGAFLYASETEDVEPLVKTILGL